jgi:hypothetical protein
LLIEFIPLQNMDLSQIEAIVAEIEREKEAGSFLSGSPAESS